MPDDPAVLWSLAGCLAEAAKDAGAAPLRAIAVFIIRMAPEFAVNAIKDVYRNNKRIIDTTAVPEMAVFMRKHSELLIGE